MKTKLSSNQPNDYLSRLIPVKQAAQDPYSGTDEQVIRNILNSNPIDLNKTPNPKSNILPKEGKFEIELGLGLCPDGYALVKGDKVEVYLPTEDYADGYDVQEATGEYPTSLKGDELKQAFQKTTGRVAKSKIFASINDTDEGGYIVTWDPIAVLWKTFQNDGSVVTFIDDQATVWEDDLGDLLRADGHEGWGHSADDQ